ncbi:MAG: DNA polymerase III subunit gamma/tau, partial [Acidimicrobiales bacterium]
MSQEPSAAMREPEGDTFVALYRRFRPQKLAEIRGQPHVVQALRGAVAEGRVAHAYLFSGPRGTGKTSAARVLAKALNCTRRSDAEPCGACESCSAIANGSSLDVRELDAASNNGVEAMRDLVSHAALATPGRWKLYIVDEVHMLSVAAANALLKTLEEPPPHVVFVLATTDPQKVPPTVRSRTQHFEFRLFGSGELTELLASVRDRADLDLDDEAVALAVRRGKGSARDALSVLDQMASSGSSEGVRPDMGAIVEGLCQEDPRAVFVAVASLLETGWSPE